MFLTGSITKKYIHRLGIATGTIASAIATGSIWLELVTANSFPEALRSFAVIVFFGVPTFIAAYFAFRLAFRLYCKVANVSTSDTES